MPRTRPTQKFITPREEDLFIDLYDMIFLDVEYLQKVIYRKENGEPVTLTTIRAHMRRMEEEGYVKSFPLARMEDRGRTKNVYTLGPKGLEEVRELIGEVKWETRWGDRTPTYVYHALQLAVIKAAYQTNRSEAFRVDFFQWLSEPRSFYKYGDRLHDVIRPDGTLVLQHITSERSVYFSYFIEMERSRQRPEVSQAKLRRYQAYTLAESYVEQPCFSVPIMPPRILFISANENEMNRLMEHTQRTNTNATSGVLYTTYEQVLADPYGKIYKAKDASEPEQRYCLFEKIQ